MDVKLLLGILNDAWFIEPVAGQQWANAAHKMLYGGGAFSAPQSDKRSFYERYKDMGVVFRTDAAGNVNEAGPVQVIRITGPIAKQDYCGAPGSYSITQFIAAANADDSVSSILLWIDSPGGQVDGTENLAKAVAASAKPIVAFTDAMMASAAYYIASAASEIVADGASNGWNAHIGSIGTMSAWEDDSEKMAKEGVKLVTVFADASSDKWDEFFAAQSGDFTRLKQRLNGMNDSFLAHVSSARAGKLSTKENVLSGKVYNAKEALKYGLIDRIGSFTDAVKRAAALAKSHPQKPSNTMSGKTLAFQHTLAAAKADAFQVVDGGFLMTEEALRNIEARLEQDAVTAVATASQLGALQAREADFSGHEATAKQLAETQQALAKATADLESAQQIITATEEKLTALEAQPGALFQSTTTHEERGDKGGTPSADEVINNLPHNQAADEFFRR